MLLSEHLIKMETIYPAESSFGSDFLSIINRYRVMAA